MQELLSIYTLPPQSSLRLNRVGWVFLLFRSQLTRYLITLLYHSAHKSLSSDKLPVFTLGIFIRNASFCIYDCLSHVQKIIFCLYIKTTTIKVLIYKNVMYISYILSWLGVLGEMSTLTKAGAGNTFCVVLVRPLLFFLIWRSCVWATLVKLNVLHWPSFQFSFLRNLACLV